MKKLISLVLCAVLALCLAVPAAAFTDVTDSDWYAEAVEYCRVNGYMDGLPGGVFDPNGGVTRAQLVTTLWRLAGKRAATAGSGFSDVSNGAWYADAVRWAVAKGITDGTGEGRFSPDAPVTREMMATFFYRFAGQPAGAGEDFADQSEISSWAREAVRWTAGAGLMKGVGGGVFDPKKPANRAALARTIMNFSENVMGKTVASELDAMCAPVGIARSDDGALWITDAFNKVVWRIADGKTVRVAGAETVPDMSGAPRGGYLDGAAVSARFASPWAIAPFLEGWAISDPENNVVRVLRDGNVWTANIEGYDYPTGIAADGEGNLFIANTHSGNVILLSPSGGVTKVAEGLDNPMGLCFADGVLYIAEAGARRVVKLENGAISLVAGSGEEDDSDGPAAEAGFFSPQAVAVGPDGSVYVSDTVGGAVRRVKDGVVTTVLAAPDPMASEVWPMAPMGLLVDGSLLYVCDRYARKLITVPIG